MKRRSLTAFLEADELENKQTNKHNQTKKLMVEKRSLQQQFILHLIRLYQNMFS